MLRLCAIAALMLVTVSPAFARWQVDDESDGGGFLFIASQVDETDTIEVQLVCDEMREGKLLFSVFTGTEMAKQKYAIAAVPITVRFGAVAFENLEGEVVGNDVERILDVSEVDEPRVRDLAAAMRKGKDMTLTYRDEEWLLTGENAAASLDTIFEHCP